MHRVLLRIVFALCAVSPGSALSLELPHPYAAHVDSAEAELIDSLFVDTAFELLKKKGIGPLLCKPKPRSRPGSIEWIWQTESIFWQDNWSALTSGED
jgi:hypothetical protein